MEPIKIIIVIAAIILANIVNFGLPTTIANLIITFYIIMEAIKWTLQKIGLNKEKYHRLQ